MLVLPASYLVLDKQTAQITKMSISFHCLGDSSKRHNGLGVGVLVVGGQAKIKWSKVKSVSRAVEKVVRSYSQVLLSCIVCLQLCK